jgi:hypothetical protein
VAIKALATETADTATLATTAGALASLRVIVARTEILIATGTVIETAIEMVAIEIRDIAMVETIAETETADTRAIAVLPHLRQATKTAGGTTGVLNHHDTPTLPAAIAGAVKLAMVSAQ